LWGGDVAEDDRRIRRSQDNFSQNDREFLQGFQKAEESGCCGVERLQEVIVNFAS
jgi:hypothetical protein